MKFFCMLFFFCLGGAQVLPSQSLTNFVAFKSDMSAPKPHHQKTNFAPFDMPAPQSSWVGATLAYNLGGGNFTEGVVGAARVNLGIVERFQDPQKPFKLFVIGNIAKITSAASEDATENINDLIQSNQGLSVGISPSYTFNPQNSDNNFRAYSTLNYKVNGFKDVGIDKKNVNLSQFRGTLGLDFEGYKIQNGGKFNISAEYIFTAVDGSLYEEVFGEKVSSFSIMEVSFIIPLPGIFGFISTIDYSTGSKPVYQFGIIMKSAIDTSNRDNL